MIVSLCSAVAGVAGAAVFGFFAVHCPACIRDVTLAFAQIVWSIAFRGRVTAATRHLGVWPESGGGAGELLLLSLGVAGLRSQRSGSSFLALRLALRATRDSPLRSEASASTASASSGRRRDRGTVAGVAGALFAYLKGRCFPTARYLASVDAL